VARMVTNGGEGDEDGNEHRRMGVMIREGGVKPTFVWVWVYMPGGRGLVCVCACECVCGDERAACVLLT